MKPEENKMIEHQSPVIQSMMDFGIFEDSPSDEFDDVLELARFITNCEASFISFNDDEWQMLKFTKGIEPFEKPQPFNQSICRLTVKEDMFLEVQDITQNILSKHLFLNIKIDYNYYAGIPLKDSKNRTFGTLCVLNKINTKLSEKQIEAFEQLSKQLSKSLQLKKYSLKSLFNKHKNQEFNILFNSSPDLNCILTTELEIININSAVQDIMGYEPEECIGQNIADFIFPEDRKVVLDTANQNLINKIKKFNVETRIINKLGETRWISWSALTKNKSWFVTGRDITQYKKTLQNLNRLSTVASKISNGVVISDANNKVVWVNDAFTIITGYNLSDVENNHLGDVIAGADSNVEEILNARKQTESKKSFSVEILAYRKDREPIWLSVYNTIILDHAGEVESIVEIIIDITERKKNQENIELLSLVASKTENGVSIADKAGNVKWLNDSLEKILGYSLEDLKGKRIGDVVAGKNTNLNKQQEAREKAVTGLPYNIDLEVKKQNGDDIWVSISSTPIFDSDGKIDKFIEIINDVSERKMVEMQLLKSKDDALHLSKAKEMFLSVMSHEIRTPLNAVIGLTNILLDEEKLENQIQPLNLLKFSSDNLLNLINDILDFSKIEMGKMELENKRINIKELIKDIVDSLVFKLSEKNLSIEYEVADGIPTLLRGDQTRIYQILINLINNAIKFTEKGFVKIKVWVANIGEDQTRLNFEVSDTGIGIAEDKFEYIFDSFTQAAANTTRKYGGSGLGLPITKRLIELYDGKIEVKSTLGEGSTFNFDLKFNNFTEEAKETLKMSEEIQQLKSKVLVVDDNEINRILAKKVLTKHGVEVVTANDGYQALALLESKDFDVVLMDIHMPGINGYETTEKLRANDDPYFKNLPIIALTASILSDDVDTIYNNGMTDYQLKPFKPADLVKKIAKYTISKS